MAKYKQYPAVDLGKYICALLVVAIHTYPFIDISPSFHLFFLSTICRLAVPFYFVCSSFFLFRKIRGPQIKDGSAKQIITAYLKRIGILYLIWAVIFIPYTLYDYSKVGFSIGGLLGWIRNFLLNGSYYHLWFLPALMLATVIVWWLYKRKGLLQTLLVCLALYGVGWLLNVFGPFWETLPGVKIVYGFYMQLFGTARNGIFFAPMFVALGLMLSRTGKPNLKASATGFAISFFCLILEVTLYAALDVLSEQTCIDLFLIPATYFLFVLLTRISLPNKPVYRQMRQDSTLIYVSHMLFVPLLLMIFPNVHLVVWLAAIALSQLLSSVIIRESEKYRWLKWLM